MRIFDRTLRSAYGVALRAFPPDFRRRFADDLVTSFDVYRSMGRSPISRLTRGVRAVVEALAQGLGERWSRLAKGRRPGFRSSRFSPSPGSGKGDPLGWLRQDAKYALRTFRRTPGFTVAALLILTLGIGASTSVFSVVNALVFRGIPFPESDRLVRIVGTYQEEAGAMERRSVSYPDFADWRNETNAFQTMVIRDFQNVTLTPVDGDPVRIGASFVSPEHFGMLRVTPTIGRLLTTEDDRTGNLVTVLSHRFWLSRFGEDREVLGRTLNLNDRTVTIVGVIQPGFDGLYGGVELWLPFRSEGAFVPNRPSAGLERRGFRGFDSFARLKPGITLDEAQAQLDRVTAGLHQSGALDPRRGALAVSFEEDNLGNAQATAYLLAGAVALVLLIACANLANLLLARQIGRARELSLRQALGATRLDLVRQILVESLILSLAGGLLGTATAFWMTGALAPDQLVNVPSYITPSIDVVALSFAIGVSLVTGVLFGLIPALNTAKLSIVESLRSGSWTTVGGGRGASRLRRSLVVVQIAVAVPLLVGSVLMIRSVSNTLAVDTGFDPNGLTVAEVTLPSERYDKAELAAFARQLRRELEARASVQRATIASDLPMNRGYSARHIQIDEPRYADQEYRIYLHRVSPGYFETLGIRVLEGREFNDRDQMDSPRVVMVSRQMAERFWPKQNPLGRSIEGARIVGVVENASYRGLVPDPENNPLDPDIFVPLAQAMGTRLQIGVRGNLPASDMSRLIRQAVTRLDPALPVYGVNTMTEIVRQQVASSSAATLQLGAFAVMALILAAAGLFGVMAYSVGRRTKEIGIRMAMGAQRGGIVSMFLVQSLILVATGLTVGVGLALGGGRLLESQLYDVSTRDGATYGLVAATFLLVGLLATSLPALKASRVDPLISLREH